MNQEVVTMRFGRQMSLQTTLCVEVDVVLADVSTKVIQANVTLANRPEEGK